VADLFIIKERLRFVLKLVAVGVAGGGLATWHFWRQADVVDGRESFLMAATVTGALVIAWVGLLVFYVSTRRVEAPAYHSPQELDSIPWWYVKILGLVLIIGGLGYAIHRLSGSHGDVFALMRSGALEELGTRLAEDPALLQRKEGRNGGTLLETAYGENRPDCVAMLVASGADPAQLAAGERNPLLDSLDNPPMLKVLLEAGFDPGLPDAEGIPPIHYAVERNLSGALSTLLRAGANADARDALSRTPLMRAVDAGNPELVRLLLDGGANPDAYDRRGDTALHKAVRRRSLEMATQLLDKGADPGLFNLAHASPLHLAAVDGHAGLVQLLLGRMGSADPVETGDFTPLEAALPARQYEAAQLLVDHGADINRILPEGDTLMHKLLEARDYRSVRFLINAGARVDIPNAKGETAFDLMRRKQLQGLIEMIEARDHPGAASPGGTADEDPSP